ncbi:mechanosensitive ion channel protein MscL [Aeromicrobium sp. Root495]|uniref:large conductance mechanosensitive channel protein MscL n=1 Tax=Aeromicrobium sp. Root495 TaxID=1736550 RepID=UPI0006F5DAD0|nr:large conductance mechanosensitive channel protein MscL [Aeromicrobium sp. Root495]KQY60291.1 mechanosensitive ion channel protein MscL [Aeromicrobium sp. Root495]RYJ07428.1 MAG: large conductance mechanosensitive channel protein MscL [Actinomycetales bacterium]
MIQGFKDFLLRGNIVDLAVAVVIGTAFTALVASFTESFLKPLIGLVGGGGKTGGTFEINGQVFTYGTFINGVITFLLTAAVVYFLVVVPMTKLNELRSKGQEPEPTGPPEDIALLREIRDSLQAQNRP